MSEDPSSLIGEPDWQRLHPSAIAIWAMGRMRTLLFGLLPALASRRLWLIGIVFVGTFVIGAGFAFLRLRRFAFRLEGEALVVRDGVIQVRHTVIPVERIQSVDIIEKLRHRIFNVVELRAEAVGGQATEATLSAIRREHAEALRRKLLRLQAIERTSEQTNPVLAKLEFRDLILAGITGGRVAVFAVILGYLDDLLPGNTFEAIFRGAVDRASRGGLLAFWLLVPILLVVGVALVLSLIATAFRYWDFTVTQEQQRLLITRGLLESRRSAIPLKRLQAVRVIENPIRRWLKLASLTVVVAGYSGQREEIQETSMLLPIANRDQAVSIAARVINIPAPGEAEFQKTPARSLFPRLTAALLVPWAVLSVPLLLDALFPGANPELGAFGLRMTQTRSIMLFGVFVNAVFAVLAITGWRARAYSFSERFVVLRSGALIRRTTFIPLANVQNMQISAGPLDRLLGLASLTFGVPKAPSKAWGLDRSRAIEGFESLGLNLT